VVGPGGVPLRDLPPILPIRKSDDLRMSKSLLDGHSLSVDNITQHVRGVARPWHWAVVKAVREKWMAEQFSKFMAFITERVKGGRQGASTRPLLSST